MLAVVTLSGPWLLQGADTGESRHRFAEVSMSRWVPTLRPVIRRVGPGHRGELESEGCNVQRPPSLGMSSQDRDGQETKGHYSLSATGEQRAAVSV